jgi:hypothetical protein
MSKIERVDCGKPEAGISPDSWGILGIFTLVVAIGLIFAAVVWSQRPQNGPMEVSPADGQITAPDRYYAKETPNMTVRDNTGKSWKVRGWWSKDRKVALVARKDADSNLFVAITNDKKVLHTGWNEASGKSLSKVEVYAVPHDGQVDGTAGFELDGAPWVLQSSTGGSILMADALLSVPHN